MDVQGADLLDTHPPQTVLYASASGTTLTGFVFNSLHTMMFVATSTHYIFSVNLQTQEVKSVAGKPGSSGMVDGLGRAARFNSPRGLFLSADNTQLGVADYGNNALRLVNLVEGRVDLLAGASDGSSGAQDGVGGGATLNGPWDVQFNADSGKVYIADRLSAAVRAPGAAWPAPSRASASGSRSKVSYA